MLMFISEIKAISSTGQEHLFSGPIIKAISFEDAQEKAIKMNPDLIIVGQYLGHMGVFNDLELS